MPRIQADTAARARKSRVVEIAEDLKIVAGDTMKEAVQATKETAKKTTAKVKSVTEKAGKETGKAVKEMKEAIDSKKTRAVELAGDAKTIVADTVKETEEKIEMITEKTVKAPAKKPKKKGPAIVIQSIMGGEITVDEILARIAAQASEQEVNSVYIKAEENRAYYVAGQEGGYIELWQ